MVCREGYHPIGAWVKWLQRFDLVNLQILALADLGIQQAAGLSIPLEKPRGHTHCGGRGIKVQARRADYPEPGAAREKVGGIQVICVGVGLQTGTYPGQGTTVDVGGGDDVGAQVNQEVVVDQYSGSLAQARSAERSCSLTVLALAEGFWIAVGSGGSQERDDHLCFLCFGGASAITRPFFRRVSKDPRPQAGEEWLFLVNDQLFLRTSGR